MMIDSLAADPAVAPPEAPAAASVARVAVGPATAVTSRAFVLRPLTFPGGSIGELAINSTVNVLAAAGVHADHLVATLVLDGGLGAAERDAEVRAMARAAAEADVRLVSGETTVVARSRTPGLTIVTTAFGRPLNDVVIDARAVRPGDRVLVSGPIGDHGVALLAARGEPGLGPDVRSDTRSIAPLVESLVAAMGSGIRWMRCPTRGVAAPLADLARDARCGIELADAAWPVRAAVRDACKCMGLDALHFATEGQFLAVVAPDMADVALATLHATPGGEDAAVIGEVVDVRSATIAGVVLDGASHVIDIARASGTGTEVRHV